MRATFNSAQEALATWGNLWQLQVGLLHWKRKCLGVVFNQFCDPMFLQWSLMSCLVLPWFNYIGLRCWLKSSV